MRTANLALRLGLELAALWAFAVGAARLGGSTVTSTAASVLAVAAGVAVWGAVVAPRARWRLADPARLVVELVFFGAAVLALAAAGHRVPAGVLAAAVLLNEALMLRWGQREH